LRYIENINHILQPGILRYPITGNIYTTANRFIQAGLTEYDSVYVALAEELGGTWLTFDVKAHKKIVTKNLLLNLFETDILF
jgi:predicted nucleic acid-binding protein